MKKIKASKVKFAVSVYVYRNDTEMTTVTFLTSKGKEGRPDYDLWYDLPSQLFVIKLKGSKAPVVYTSMANIAYFEVLPEEHAQHADEPKTSAANSAGIREETRRSGRHSRS